MSGVRAPVAPRAAAPVAPAAVRLSRAGDVHEREADRFAETVEPEGSPRQAAAAVGSAADPVKPATSFARAVTSTPGSPLSPETRREYGDRLGHDFGDVRVHADREAAAAADAVSARAFTRGRHIFFAAGEYRPATPAGRHLLAHELAHTRQGRGGAAAPDAIARQAVETPSAVTAADAAANAIIDILRGDPAGGVRRARAQLAGLDPMTRDAALTQARALATPDLQAQLVDVSRAPARTPQTSAMAPGQAPRPPATPRPERPAITTTAPVTTPSVPGAVTAPGTLSALGQGGPRATAEATMAAGEVAPEAKAAAAEQRAAADAQAEYAGVTKRTEGESSTVESATAADVAESGDVPDLRARVAPLAATAGGEPGEAPLPLPAIDLIVAADKTEEPSGEGLATSEPPLPATTPAPETGTPAVADIAPLIARLAAARDRADVTVAGQVSSENSRLSARASGLKRRVASTVTARVATIRGGFTETRGAIDDSVAAAHTRIGTALTDRQTEANALGETFQVYFTMQFSDHRANLDTTITNAVTDIEGLRTSGQNRIRNLLTEQAAQGRANAQAREAAFPDTERGRLQKNAISEIATKTLATMEAQIPVAVEECGDVFKALPGAFRDYGAQARKGFDDSLPAVLASTMMVAGETSAGLIPQAARARAPLEQEAATIRTRLTGMETEAVAQAEEIAPRAAEQIDAALQAAQRQVRWAGKAATNRIHEVVAQAISVLGEAEAPDPTSAEEFTAEIEAFAAAAAEGAGEPIAEFASGVGGVLGGVLADANVDLGKVETIARARRQGLATATDEGLAQYVTAVDRQLASSVGELGTVFAAKGNEIDSQLREAIAAVKTAFTTTWNDAWSLLGDMIRDTRRKNTDLLQRLDADMRWAAYEVGWAYDHPYLDAFEDALSVIAGILLALQALALVVVAVIVAFYVAVAALSVIIPEAVAIVIVKLAMLAWVAKGVYGAYRARRQQNENGVSAVFGAFGDVTGITQIVRGATQPHLSPLERAYDITHGAGTALLTVLGFARGARGPITKIKVKIAAIVPRWLANPSQVRGPRALEAGARPDIKPVASIEPVPGARAAEAPPPRITEPAPPPAAEPVAPRAAAEPAPPRVAAPARPAPEPSPVSAGPGEGKLIHLPPPAARPPRPARAAGETGPAPADVIPILRPPSPRLRPGAEPAAAPKPAEPVAAAEPIPAQLAEAAEVAVQPRLIAGGGGGRPQIVATAGKPPGGVKPPPPPATPLRSIGTGGPGRGGGKRGSPPASPPGRGPAAAGTPPTLPPRLKVVPAQPPGPSPPAPARPGRGKAAPKTPRAKPRKTYYGGGGGRARGLRNVRKVPQPTTGVTKISRTMTDAERAMVADAERLSVRMGRPLQIKTKAVAGEGLGRPVQPGVWRRRGVVRSGGTGEQGAGVARTQAVMETGQQIGHNFHRNSSKDAGVPGQSAASHGEKQAVIANPGRPVAVDRVMCADCFAFFQRLAQARRTEIVIHEPGQTWVFRPDGVRVGLSARTRVVIHPDGSASATPLPPTPSPTEGTPP